MTRSSTKELLSPFENPKQKFPSRRRLFDTPSLVESNSPESDHIFDIEEQSEEEVRETMTETMEQYMSKTRRDYGSGVTRPMINQDTHFELKGQFLKEIRDNTFSGSKQEDANKHIEKKWHNGTSSRTRSTETSDGLAAIQAQLNNLGREIKKVNEKFSAHPINLEDNIEQQGQDSTNKAMETLPIRNQGASTKTLEIQIGQMSKVLQERGFGSLPSSTKTTTRDQVKSISTAKADFSEICHFIILDILEDDDVPLILGRPFLSTAHYKIDVFKRKITLRVGEEKLVFKSIKPAASIIKRVFVIKSLDSKTELVGEGDEPFESTYGNYIELNDLDTPLEPKTNRDVDFEPTFVKTDSYKMKFSCVIGCKYVNADLLPSLSINLMSKIFYYSIIKNKDEGKSHTGTLIDILVFVGSFSIVTGFTIIDGDDITKDVVLGTKFYKKYASCQMIMKKFAHRDECERIDDE
ncbi:reverse transcriptase domain-containing protein [Tanacetum coccineum]